MHGVVSCISGVATAFCIESHPAKCIILAGVVLCFQRDSFSGTKQPTWAPCNSESDAAQHAQAKLDVEVIPQGPLVDGKDSAGINGSNPDDYERLKRGLMQYGCAHYRRRCRIWAPCCDEIFDCRHCHNESKNSIKTDVMRRHELSRHEVQQVGQICINCGVCMGKYFCEVCKLFHDDVSKQQYHCHGCGICRIGGKENFFHCSKCRCCYSTIMKNCHPCVEGAMHHDCPICFEYLFDSTDMVCVLLCGHTIHENCVKEMKEHHQFVCPLCSKSVCDMSEVWERLDMRIARLPDSYDGRMVSILCNDCVAIAEVHFNLIALKCQSCNSYNTRRI